MVKRRECVFDQLALRINDPQPRALVVYRVDLAYACNDCLALQGRRLDCAARGARRSKCQFIVVTA